MVENSFKVRQRTVLKSFGIASVLMYKFASVSGSARVRDNLN